MNSFQNKWTFFYRSPMLQSNKVCSGTRFMKAMRQVAVIVLPRASYGSHALLFYVCHGCHFQKNNRFIEHNASPLTSGTKAVSSPSMRMTLTAFRASWRIGTPQQQIWLIRQAQRRPFSASQSSSAAPVPLTVCRRIRCFFIGFHKQPRVIIHSRWCLWQLFFEDSQALRDGLGDRGTAVPMFIVLLMKERGTTAKKAKPQRAST